LKVVDIIVTGRVLQMIMFVHFVGVFVCCVRRVKWCNLMGMSIHVRLHLGAHYKLRASASVVSLSSIATRLETFFVEWRTRNQQWRQ